MLTTLDRYAEFFALVVLGLSGCSSPEKVTEVTSSPRTGPVPASSKNPDRE